MGFFDLFRKKGKTQSRGRRQSRTSVAKLKKSFEKATIDIDALAAEG